MDTLTFGQKAVGLKFNHATGDTYDAVDASKRKFAELIDVIGDPGEDKDRHSWMYNILRTAAINTLIAAQMAHVKFLTWKD